MDLNLAGIQTNSYPWQSDKNNSDFIASQSTRYIIYNITQEFIDHLQSNNQKLNLKITSSLTADNQRHNSKIILLAENNIVQQLDEDLTNCICISSNINQQNDYYFLAFDILEEILFSYNLKDNINEFKKQYHILTEHVDLQHNAIEEEVAINKNINITFKKLY